MSLEVMTDSLLLAGVTPQQLSTGQLEARRALQEGRVTPPLRRTRTRVTVAVAEQNCDKMVARMERYLGA
ncbi:hypothetical protein KBAHV01_10090 [Aeromonas hydrophila]|nr:hypothetical protein KBAHV01_10090 [Aeromonas hydrophila]